MQSAQATVLLASLVLLACDRSEGSNGRSGGSQSKGLVVATVGSTPIELTSVQELVNRTGLTPVEALRRLEEAALLEQHARELGYEGSTAQAMETKRALVRTLLAATVEAEIRPETIPAEQVRQRYEQVASAKKLPREDFPKYEPDVRTQLVLEARKAALDKLLAKLRMRDGVVLEEATVQKLLADPKLWGPSS